MLVGRTQLETALRALGELLSARDLRFELVLIGGGNLILRGMIARPTTKDLDVLGEWTGDAVRPLRPLPEPLRTAIEDVARTYGLARDWINVGPDSIVDLGLPDGFGDRLERADFGGLVVWFAGRLDMVCFKLHAAVDQGSRSRHFQDLQELRPERSELVRAARWTITHDSSLGFRSLLVGTLGGLGIEDGDALLR